MKLISRQIVIFRANFFRPPSKMPSRTPMVTIRSTKNICIFLQHCEKCSVFSSQNFDLVINCKFYCLFVTCCAYAGPCLLCFTRAQSDFLVGWRLWGSVRSDKL